MKIATLTLPFHPNYGAVLQAFSLQKILEELGHETECIDITYRSLRPTYRNILSDLKTKLTNRKPKILTDYGNVYFKKFINEEINKTNQIIWSYQFKNKKIFNFDAYVVGSDQVWREEYSKNIKRYLFDFVEDKPIKIAYAASFGTNSKLIPIDKYLTLAKKFKSVSVREKDGIRICKNFLGVSAKQVIDPTLLIDPNYFNNIIKRYSCSNAKLNKYYCYILDQSPAMIQSLNDFNSNVYIENYMAADKDKISIGDWLKRIRDSSFIITDSFHGVVFSIIFNKRFVAIGNSRRGLSRFESILNLFGLEERLILDCDLTSSKIENILQKKLDIESINTLKNKYKNEGINFLKESLGID